MSVDRSMFFDAAEAARLRDSARLWADADRAAGRRQGVVAWALVDLALSTGLRRAELAAIRCGDVDLSRRGLSVRAVKGGRDRTVSLYDVADHLGEFLDWKAGAGEPTDPAAPLLRGIRGPFTPNGLARVWRQAVVRAGLPALSIHGARRTFATLVASRGRLEVAKECLGHKDITTTARHYAGVTWDDMERGVKGLYERGGT